MFVSLSSRHRLLTKSLIIILAATSILLHPAIGSCAKDPTKFPSVKEVFAGNLRAFSDKVKSLLWYPIYLFTECVATVEACVNLNSIKDSELRYNTIKSSFISQGEKWGDLFVALDVNPNKSKTRKWDYRVRVRDSGFLVEARRKSGEHAEAIIWLDDSGKWGGNYKFGLHRKIAKFFFER